MSATSLTSRLALAFALLVGLTALVFGAAGYVTTERQVTGQVDDFLRDRAKEIAEGQRQSPSDRRDNGNDRDGRGDRGAGAVDDDAIVQILDGDGSVILPSGTSLPVSELDIDIARSGSTRTQLKTISLGTEQLRVITRGVSGGGAVRVARYLQESNNVISGVRSQLLWIVLGAGALAGAFGAWMAARIAGPIKALATTVDSVAATRDFSTPIEVQGSDEVERLASGFDNLLRSLAASQHQQNQLVQDVAHELRTPLTSIRANVDMLSMVRNMDDDERQQTLDSVRLELRELTTLVNEIVEVAAQGGESTSTRKPLDLADVANVAVERFRLRTGRDVSVNASPSMVIADHDGLLRALANLLSNAGKYSPAAEPVAVSVPGDGWIHVTDRGFGMSETDRERAYDRFYRADEARGKPGSGLGLAIVRSIAEGHGGQVRLASNPGGGTVASIYVPLAR